MRRLWSKLFKVAATVSGVAPAVVVSSTAAACVKGASAPVMPRGMVKLSTTLSGVPPVVTAAVASGPVVVTVPTEMAGVVPAGPVSPEGPVGPAGPVSPEGPVAPVAPVGPVALVTYGLFFILLLNSFRLSPWENL